MAGEILIGALLERSSVYPSGAARAASNAPMVPPAPGLLSTMTDWPSSACKGTATRRATISDEPPGEKVTTTRTGLVGHVWAAAFPQHRKTAIRTDLANILSSPY